MNNARWLVLALFPLQACNCQHRGSAPGPGTIVGEDATPAATWQAQAGAAWSAPPVDYGTVPIGGRKVVPIKLANAGSLALSIASTTLRQGQSGAPEFSFTEVSNARAPFGDTIPQGSSAIAYLSFQPSRGGEQTATLVIQSNSNATPEYDVPIRGDATNVSISVAPTVLDFGNVQIGTYKTLPVTFTNQGTDTSDAIQVAKPTGTQAADFGWTGTPEPLGPGQSFTLQVTFTPAAPQGPDTALVEYLQCPTCTPTPITLQGVGVDGDLVFDPDPACFGCVNKVPQGQTKSKTIGIANMGLAKVSLTSLAIKGVPSPFSLSNPPATGLVLDPGGSTQVVVNYTASVAGNDQDVLVALAQPLDDQGKPVDVLPEEADDPLVGNGQASPCSLQVSPPALNFGNPAIGTAVQMTVTLTNLGQQVCDVKGIGMGPGTDSAFSLPAGAPASLSLPPNANGTITVSCDIASSNPPLYHRGTLVFQSNDTNRPSAVVPLSAYVKGHGPYADGWPKWHADNTDEGQSQADTSANNGTILWRWRVGVPQSAGGMLGMVDPNPTYMNSPVVDGSGTVYQLGMDGTFWAIDSGGNKVWSVMLSAPNPDEHPATPIIAADNTIYVESGCDGSGAGGNGGLLYHLDAATGKILASVPPPACPPNCDSDSTAWGGGADGFDVNPSIGNDGLLFDGDDFGQTVVYTPGAGGAFPETNHVILSWMGERVAVALDQDDNSYWCSLNICFGVTSPANGFTVMPGWPSGGAPIGKTGGVGGGLGGLTSWINSDLAFDANHTGWLMVEAGTQNGSTGSTEIVAMDPTNGQIKWDTPLPSGPTPSSWDPATEQGIFNSDVGNSAPAIAASDGTVYVGNVDGLYALNGQTGAIRWTFKTPSDVVSAAAIGSDGTIFFGTADGTFFAVDSSGKQRFQVKTTGKISSSPAIGPDGTVFFVSDNGQLYAVR